MTAERTDTERLDAIERHGWDVLRWAAPRCTGWRRGWALFYTAVDFLNAPTLREAIDAAIAKKGGA